MFPQVSVPPHPSYGPPTSTVVSSPIAPMPSHGAGRARRQRAARREATHIREHARLGQEMVGRRRHPRSSCPCCNPSIASSNKPRCHYRSCCPAGSAARAILTQCNDAISVQRPYTRRIHAAARWPRQPRKGLYVSWSMEYPVFCGAWRSSSLERHYTTTNTRAPPFTALRRQPVRRMHPTHMRLRRRPAA